mgnify:CR=1 FL=1
MLLSPGVTNDGGFGLVSYRGISGLYKVNGTPAFKTTHADWRRVAALIDKV